MRRGDVVVGRREDVEDEPPAGEEDIVRRADRAAPLVVGVQVEVRAERADHERDALLDRRAAQVAEP